MLLLINIIDAVCFIGHMLIQAYMIVVIAACALTWFRVSPYHPAAMALNRLAEPSLRLARRVPFTRAISGVDLSPLVVIIALELVDLIVVRTLRQMLMG